MAHPDVIVIGGSAGGIEAASEIFSKLPKDLAAALFLVIHTAPDSPGYLDAIFSMACALPVRYARHGESFATGTVYLAPPNFHLVLDVPRKMLVLKGPRENRTRPAVDPLFRSAALAFGPRVIGIILSGGLDDGAAGLRGIKLCGGTTIAQDPGDAAVPSMPANALQSTPMDFSLPASEIGALLINLVQTSVSLKEKGDPHMRKELEIEVNMVKGLGGEIVQQLGEPSLFTCPECHGSLTKLRGDPLRFRCHTGHAFTADSLLAELSETTEGAIWNTMRSLQESSMLLKHLAEHSKSPHLAQTFLKKAAEAEEKATVLRELSEKQEALSVEKIDTPAE
jgi:two-component system, chemotaxis family, protein-glutamate methylesterase/glutaminase